MKTKEFRQLPDEDLLREAGKRREQIFRMRLKAGSDEVASSGSLRNLRRDIARIKTLLGERAAAATTAGSE